MAMESRSLSSTKTYSVQFKNVVAARVQFHTFARLMYMPQCLLGGSNRPCRGLSSLLALFAYYVAESCYEGLSMIQHSLNTTLRHSLYRFFA